jgi:alginate O-acetyltransferase complex protein AlgI
MNYRVGIFLGEESYSAFARKAILFTGITLNLLLLFYFKYTGFALKTISEILSFINASPVQTPIIKIILPLGISFYTFQSISYLVDVYKNQSLVQRNVLDIGLYISFFPALIAGPIVRYHDIKDQIKERKPSVELFIAGIERFIIGLAKKVLIANVMAEMADIILGLKADSVPFHYLALAILCYTIQIYYDFSGYSDMAIGLGKMFGFTLLENFNYPYISKSITEFWRRWHISLSSWFRDYVYIPLGGNRKGKIRTTINLFIVFFTTGLWHGAAIQFVFWGFMHGMLLFIEKIFGQRIGALIKNSHIKNILGHLYTMTSVIILWVFFRIGTKKGAIFLLNLFTLNPGNKNISSYLQSFINPQFIVCFIAALVFIAPWWRKLTFLNRYDLTPVKYIVLIVLLILSMGSLATNTYNPFIYFRF